MHQLNVNTKIKTSVKNVGRLSRVAPLPTSQFIKKKKKEEEEKKKQDSLCSGSAEGKCEANRKRVLGGLKDREGGGRRALAVRANVTLCSFERTNATLDQRFKFITVLDCMLNDSRWVGGGDYGWW